MAYNLEPTNENVQRIAHELTRQHTGYSPTQPIAVDKSGVMIPMWLLFVGEAQKIWLAHLAANNLDWEGRKLKG